jgi:hypothetical protein
VRTWKVYQGSSVGSKTGHARESAVTRFGILDHFESERSKQIAGHAIDGGERCELSSQANAWEPHTVVWAGTTSEKRKNGLLETLQLSLISFRN